MRDKGTVQVAEPAKSTEIVQLGAVCEVPEEVPVARTAHNVPAVRAISGKVRFIEEPDVGKPQVLVL